MRLNFQELNKGISKMPKPPCMVVAAGFEPTVQESKSCAFPLGYATVYCS